MLATAARIFLFPILAWQAARVRRVAVRLPDAVGPRTGVRGQGCDIRLLILGDSSAAGVGTLHQDEALLGHMVRQLCQTGKVHWALDARTGATTADTIERLQNRVSRKFDLVSVSLGVNDITSQMPLHIWLEQYAALLDLLQNKFDPAVICVSGMPHMQHFPLLPQPLRWVAGAMAAKYDRALRKLVAARKNCRFVTMDFDADTSLMSEDGFHPGPEIYAQWGQKVYRTIRPDLKHIKAQS